MGENKRLIHFGCWNRTAGEEGYVRMIPTLKQYIFENSTDVVLVAGDNYYPQKNKDKKTKQKVKTVADEKLNAGFYALKDAVGSVPTYVILGNHDVEKINGDCEIATLESSQKSPPNFDVTIFKMFRWTPNTVVVMFDTTLYEDDIAKDFECYSRFGNTDELQRGEQPQELIDRQRGEILDFLRRESDEGGYSNVIMVGHFPIISAKQKEKDGKKTDKFELNKFANDLIVGICNTVGADKHMYYLCADVHMYQYGTISLSAGGQTYNVEQYVVGTGGAELDDVPSSNNYRTSDSGIDYSIDIKDAKATNGFLVCEESTDGSINMRFSESPLMVR